MKKLISLLLALVLILSVIPLAASADSTADSPKYNYSDYTLKDGKWFDKDDNEVASDLAAALWKEHDARLPVHELNQHTYGIAYNTKYHWKECACGAKISMEPHLDPKDAKDDYCTCGYHFSDNADLVTLWINGCPPIKNFNKNTTEYKLNAYTYKDVKQIKISTRTFDSEATVELPEDLTLKEGSNTFEIKVVAENQKVTKTYTVTITK